MAELLLNNIGKWQQCVRKVAKLLVNNVRKVAAMCKESGSDVPGKWQVKKALEDNTSTSCSVAT